MSKHLVLLLVWHRTRCSGHYRWYGTSRGLWDSSVRRQAASALLVRVSYWSHFPPSSEGQLLVMADLDRT